MPLRELEPDRPADCLTLVWELPATSDAVWAHLQNVEALSEWLGRPLAFDSRVGGEIIVDHDDSYLCRSEVLAIGDHSAQLTWSFPDEPTSRIEVIVVPDLAVAPRRASTPDRTNPPSDTGTTGLTSASANGSTASATSLSDSSAEAGPGSVLTLRHFGLGVLIDSYATGWIAHLSFFEASVAGTPLPSAQFWPLCATVDRLLDRGEG